MGEGAMGWRDHWERCWGWKRESFPCNITVLLGFIENLQKINWATDAGQLGSHAQTSVGKPPPLRKGEGTWASRPGEGARDPGLICKSLPGGQKKPLSPVQASWAVEGSGRKP